MRVLDLCSGTESIRRSLEAMLPPGELVYVSVDNVPKFAPTYCVDILTWDFEAALAG